MSTLDRSLRDTFALEAMKILLSNPELANKYVDDSGCEMGDEVGSVGTWYPHTRFFGEDVYQIADEIMGARK